MRWSAERLFAGPGEVRHRLRTAGWDAAGPGPVEAWPVELRLTVQTVLRAELPMLLWWGPRNVQIVNDACLRLLGDRLPDAVARPAAESWAGAWEELRPSAEHVLTGQGAVSVAEQRLLVPRDGVLEETFWTLSFSPVESEGGQVSGVLVTAVELTDQVLTERRLETVRDLGTVSVTEAASAAEVCRAVAEVLGGERADVPYIALYLHDGDAGYALRASAEVTLPHHVSADGPEPFDVVLREGTTQPLGHTGALILPLTVPGRNAPVGLLVTGTSPHRRLDEDYRRFLDLLAGRVAALLADALAHEQERARAQKLAEAEATKTQLLQDFGHEFRTPLTLLLGPLEQVLTEHAKALPGPVRDSLDAAHRAALRLTRLVDTLLDIAQADAQALQPRLETVDVAAVTEDCTALFRSSATKAGLDLDVRIAGDARSPVRLDPEMWAKILLNLLSNAIKFTVAGSISVTLVRSGDELTLTVADTGIGIPAFEQDRIFDRFHRAGGGAGRDGAGIGLALAADLTAALGGTIAVRSAVGAGSEFTVTVPAPSTGSPPGAPLQVREIGAAYTAEAQQWRADARPASANGQGRRILVVDDDADLRSYLVRLLGEQDWHVNAVPDAASALAGLRRSPRPDLVLADVMLPGDDGIELLRAIRADPDTSRLPVLLLTARAGVEASLAGLRHGADDYLVKPVHPVELIARVRVHLELSIFREALLATRARETEQLRTALKSRTTLSTAVGLIMATFRCDPDTAFERLATLSKNRNIKARDLADEIVAQFVANLDPPADTP